ncbi:hypothetical protein QYE76_017573 [Lolium multiflorum]|uniref:Protein FAR1-RELATED SEQUENCE n=1 Tax=Lolium multiflorum TaxID=4521 RepID=A0AAD8PMT6_LOLMU|nr:hypothetical protein QYE76_017573 [Lolium multiflorum]
MIHIATGTAPSLDGELLPLHESSSVDEDGGGDGSGGDGEAFRGHPSPAVPNRLLSPHLGFAMAAALKERDDPHCYRYSPEPRWRTTPSSWGAAALMKMAVEMAVSMEKPSGALPRPGVRNRDSCPPDLGFAMAAALEVKIESSRRCAKDGELDKFVYVCNKSGKPREEEAVPVKQRNRKLTVLTDCKAKLRVKRDGARWKVTQFVEVHTHEVIDKFALKKYLRSHNKIPAEEKKFIDLLHEVNLTSGRIMEIMGELYGSKQNVPYNSKTVSNYTAKLGNYDRIKDIPELLEYFEEIKKDDPRFFYRFKLDAENKVENLFWVDSKARDVYPLYNDCISFDTTFMTNQFCRWHIMQKVQEKLGTFVAQREDLRLEFNDVIDYSMTPEEFEQRWANMVETHGVADNTHFLDLYDLREYFVPAYFRHRFFPFLQTTSRSEGFNVVLKQYVHPHDSLVRFFKQYMKLQERIDVTEDAHEFDGDEKTVRLWGDFPMEKQILQTYTMPIYHRFQLELRKITSYNVRDIGVTEQGSIHEVFPIQGSVRGYGRRSYRVDADVANGIYNCECCKINRDGILCCHAMKVMSHLGMVTKYPEHYILPRWCLPPPDIVAPRDERQERPVGQKLSRKDMRLLRYGNLCSDFAKLAVGLAASEKTNEIAERHMRAMEKEMADLKKANADALKKRKSAKHAVNTNTANDSQESVPMEEDAATVENWKGPIFARSFQKPKREGSGPRGADTIGRRLPRPRRPRVWGPRVAPALPFRLLKASVVKPQTESHDTENLPDAPPRIPSRGFRDPPHPAGEGFISGGLFIAMIAPE